MKTSHRASSPIGYRPDIDGLRAICVIAVVGFHIGVPGFGGGYVGVDVFFVISGYLITLLLIAPSHGTLMQQLSAFYIRRARRILPALIVLLVVSSVAAVVLFFAVDLRSYGRSLTLAATMLGNLGALLNGGYYNVLGRHTPLQHLWSIGVEEQFYLAFPLLLLLAGRLFREQRTRTVALLAAASFALCVWASYRSPAANYYFSPTRAWQLLLGSFVALTPTHWILRGRWNEVVAASSFIALVAVVCSYSSTTRYPGVPALLPTLASAGLLIARTPHTTVVGRVLSLPPLVFTGLISYSLYLWHAPILAFVEYYNIEPLNVAETCALVVSLYAIATLSWAFVEKPVRTRTVLRSDAAFVAVAAGSTALLVLVGVVFWRTGGLPERFSPDVQKLTKAAERPYPRAADCAASLTRIRQTQLCSFGSNDPAASKVVVWGDSHAFALLPAYEALAQAHGLRVYFGSIGACRPLIDVKSRYDSDFRRAACTAFNEAMLQAVERLDPELIVFNAYWGYPDTDLVIEDGEPATSNGSAYLLGFERVLHRTRIPPRSACVVLTVPIYEQVVPYALAMARRKGRGDDVVAMSRVAAFEQSAIVERALRRLEARGLVRVVDPKERLCPGDTCELRTPSGKLLYRDAHHLSIDGARFVAPVLEGCLHDRSGTAAQ